MANQITMFAGSPSRRSRRIAHQSASAAPATMSSSSTGSVQFASPNGFLNVTQGEACSQLNPRRLAMRSMSSLH